MESHIPVDTRLIGVTFPAGNQATVRVWAPLANHVALHLHESSKKLPLVREELGYWTLKTDEIKPGDLYTIILNEEAEHPDPASLSQPQGFYGPSQAIDITTFYWEDQSWVNPPLEDYLIYELHTATFTPEGTFAAIESKLDYLKALGITAIEIMPVAQFSDDRNWGYDGVFTHAVQHSYGGASDLQHLINACHFRGIAVVLDVVYNHFGPQGGFLKEFGPYLTNKYCTPWGDAVNFDDAWCDGVRQFVIENVLMWFRDFQVDALRLDAVHAIKDCSARHILAELREHVDRLMASTGRRHYLIAECDLNDPRFINPLSEHGYGMDAQWIDEFHHSLRVTVGEKRIGYYADFNGINHLAKAYQDGYVYDGQFSEVRQKLFGCKAENNPGQQFIVFSQNHDQVGNRRRGERSSQLFSFSVVKLMAGAVLVSPYIPLLFMGEEWGESNPFLFFSGHQEPEIANMVREGRQAEFASFHSEHEAPDPQDEETFYQSKLQWDLVDQEPHQTLLRYYQTLIALRQQLPALHKLNRHQMEVIAYEDQQTIVLHRWHDDQHTLCLMNFSKESQSLSMAITGGGTKWQKLLDSSDNQWELSSESESNSAPDYYESTMAPVSIQAESIVIYAQGHEKFHINVPDPISQRFHFS
ncbi:malto-oligosyltrehalose trehalohydrolase [Spirosoma harenae]